MDSTACSIRIQYILQCTDVGIVILIIVWQLQVAMHNYNVRDADRPLPERLEANTFPSLLGLPNDGYNYLPSDHQGPSSQRHHVILTTPGLQSFEHLISLLQTLSCRVASRLVIPAQDGAHNTHGLSALTINDGRLLLVVFEIGISIVVITTLA